MKVRAHLFVGVVFPSCSAHLRAATGLESGVSICREAEGKGLSPSGRCAEVALEGTQHRSLIPARQGYAPIKYG